MAVDPVPVVVVLVVEEINEVDAEKVEPEKVELDGVVLAAELRLLRTIGRVTASTIKMTIREPMTSPATSLLSKLVIHGRVSTR